MYPDETIAVSKTGKKEARILKAGGRFIIYGYEALDGKDEMKYSILLAREDGRIEHLMLLPVKGKELVLKHSFEDKGRAVFDAKRKRVVRFP